MFLIFDLGVHSTQRGYEAVAIAKAIADFDFERTLWRLGYPESNVSQE